MKQSWFEFDETLGSRQKLPKERKYVLVQITGDEEKGIAPSVVVGYLRYAAGDRNSPQFITPGGGRSRTRIAVAWLDCLPNDFCAPLWGRTSRE